MKNADTFGRGPFALVSRTALSLVVSIVKELPLLPSTMSFGLFGSVVSLVKLLR